MPAENHDGRGEAVTHTRHNVSLAFRSYRNMKTGEETVTARAKTTRVLIQTALVREEKIHPMATSRDEILTGP